MRAVAGKRLDWDEAAPRLLGGQLGTIAEKAGHLEARALRVKEALAAVETRHAPTLVGFRMAGGFLEEAAFKAGVARELARLAPGQVEGSLERMAAARQELGGVRQNAVEAEATLRELSGRAAETPWALREVREIQRAASSAQVELSQTESRAQMLAAMDAGSLLASAPASDEVSAGDEARISSEPVPEFEFTEEDLARIGTGLDPSKPAPQTQWSEQMVNTVCELGRQQGGVTDEQGGRNFELAKVVLGSSEGATDARPLEGVDLAAVLKMAGVDLAKVDPNQLQSAARYVSEATSLEDQQQKLRKAIDNFQVLEKIGLPKMTRQQMADALWGVAKVPTHALQKLSDADVAKKLQEVLAAVNAGPGKSEIKVGKHNLKIEVGQNGQVTKSSCKKPGFFSKLKKIAKIVTPIALTVMSFIPVTAPFALAAQGVISMYNAVKSKSLLGIATAAASLVGGAGAIVGKFAGAAAKAADTASKAAQAMKTAATAARVAKIANSAGRALQGVSSLKSGNIIGGLASIGSGIASGISTFAAGAAKGLGKFADNLNKVSTKLSAVGTGVASFEGYKRASQAVSEAKQSLAAAQASGNPRAIADAEKRLSQAESQKRAAVIGGAAGAASAASAWVENRSLFADQSKSTLPAQTDLQSKLRFASQGLGVAQSVVAKDYAGAAVAALSFGSTVKSAQKDGQPNRLNDAANMAEAGLGYYRAEKGRSAANEAVSEAQDRLESAKLSGDSEEIAHAEAELKAAKGGAESALMGGIAAGESLVGTARDIGDRYHAERQEKAKVAQKAATDATIAGRKTAEGLQSLAEDPNAAPEVREAARAEQQKLKAADRDFQKAIAAAKGDPEAIAKAVAEFEGVRSETVAHVLEASRTAPPGSAPSASGAPAESSSPGFASLRRPQNIASARVTKGVTLWEVSQRTGVPVERILEFNTQSGNPLDAKNLQIGQTILVPMDPEDVQFKAKTAEQVRDLKQRAAAAKAKETAATSASSDAKPGTAPVGRPVDAPTRAHDASGDAAALYQSMKGGLFGAGTDEATIYRVLEGKSPSEIASIRASYKDHYGRDLDADIDGEFSGAELSRAKNLLQGNRAAADADAIHYAAKGGTGIGTDEATIEHVLQGRKPEERAAIAAEYKSRYGVELQTVLADELSGPERQRAEAQLKGQDARADAAAVNRAVTGAGTDEASLFQVLDGKSPAQRAAIETEYRQLYGRELATDLTGDLSGADLDRALSGTAPQAAPLSPAERLYRATSGLGTDEAEIRAVLAGKTADEIRRIEEDYRARYKTELRADLEGDLSGREAFEVLQALKGRPQTPEEALQRMNEAHAYEREGLLNAPGGMLLDLVNAEGDRLDRNVALANQQYKEAMADGKLDAAEAARLATLVGYAGQDVASYQDSKDSAANIVSTTGATLAAAGVVIATGGSGTPVAAAILKGAIAGAVTKVALSGAVEGEGYGWEQGVTDATTGAVDGATVAAFAPLGRVVAGAALRGTAETAATRVVGGTIAGGIEGTAGGAVSGGAQEALRDGAWSEGVGAGLQNVAGGAAMGAASGLVGGAIGGGLGGLRARSTAPHPDIAPADLAREADAAMKELVDRGMPPAQAREVTEQAVRDLYPEQAGQIFGETPATTVARTSPRQGVGDFEELYRQAAVAQDELGLATREIAEATGGNPVVPALKGRERALEKIATDYGGDASGILDLARSSIEFQSLDDLYKAVDDLGERFKIVRLKDRFQTPTAEGYRDLLVNVETSNGHIAEIQLHLKSILDVKSGPGHALYEQIRSIEAAAVAGNRPITAAERELLESLREQSRRLYDAAAGAGSTSQVRTGAPEGTSAAESASKIAPEKSRFDRKAATVGFQDHHIVSDKNPLTKSHELLDLAGFDLQKRGNKIYLPEDPALHPTRSIHKGRHSNAVSERLANQMDQVVEVGKANAWTQNQYLDALRQLIREERLLLRAGRRALNKNKRPGAL